jgi:hypothetical protein
MPAAFFHKLFHRRIHFNAAVPPDPFHPQYFLPAVDRALLGCIHAAWPLPNIPLPSGFFEYGKKGLCPQISQMDADEEFLFRICVNLAFGVCVVRVFRG